MIDIGDFQKIDLRVGEIIDAQDHPRADKLFLLKIRMGDEEKTVVAGIKGSYEKGSLIGKQVVAVNNLNPAVIRGEKSEGMLLACHDEEGGIVLLAPEKPVKTGIRVK